VPDATEGLLIAKGTADMYLLPQMANRHGLVAGATGNQGGAVARALLAARGWKVRGITRDPNKPEARELARLGAEMVRADLYDSASLGRALEGAYGAFSVENFWVEGYEGEVRQGRNLANAAKASTKRTAGCSLRSHAQKKSRSLGV